MKKTAGLAIVAVSTFNGESAEADKNGLMPVYLTPICGEIPNRNVISGTVAQNNGFEEGKSYLAKWTRLEDDAEYGAQVDWVKVNEVTDPMVIISSEASLGAGKVFDITSVRTSAPAGSQEN